MQALRIEARPITPDDQIRRNMDYALSLGLPEADGGPLKHLTVVANGPSARHLPLWPEGDTLALNGALKLFRTKGASPTYWAGCDPQPMVADFLDDPPDSTIYFVASKCDKAVFDALKGRDVRLWHIAD